MLTLFVVTMKQEDLGTTCSTWGDNWTDEMPEEMGKEAAKNGIVADSCLE